MLLEGRFQARIGQGSTCGNHMNAQSESDLPSSAARSDTRAVSAAPPPPRIRPPACAASRAAPPPRAPARARSPPARAAAPGAPRPPRAPCGCTRAARACAAAATRALGVRPPLYPVRSLKADENGTERMTHLQTQRFEDGQKACID